MAMSRCEGGKPLIRAAGNGDVARGDRLQPGNGVEQGGLAAAGRANEHEKAALFDLDIDVLQDLERSVGLA